MVPLFTATLSSASPSFVVTGVVKNSLKETTTLPFLRIKIKGLKIHILTIYKKKTSNKRITNLILVTFALLHAVHFFTA